MFASPVFGEQFGQFMGNGLIHFVDGTAFEVGTRGLQGGELRQRVKAKKGLVGVRVRQVISGNVGHGGNSIVNVVLLGIFHDVIGRRFGTAKHALLLVQGGQVDVYHFGVIPHTNLKIKKNIYIN